MSEFQIEFPILAELDRLHQNFDALFTGMPSSIRTAGRVSFPPINVGSTDETVEIVAFAPGIDPKSMELTIDRGVLTLSGERREEKSASEPQTRRYAQERFTGKFRRVIELPQNIDSSKVQARYANGCLTISVAKQQPSRATPITIQSAGEK